MRWCATERRRRVGRLRGGADQVKEADGAVRRCRSPQRFQTVFGDVGQPSYSRDGRPGDPSKPGAEDWVEDIAVAQRGE